MRRILVLGASGAIGGAMLRSLAAAPDAAQIIAASRSRAPLPDGVQWHPLDYEQPGRVAQLAATLAQQFDALDEFICATGHLHDDQMAPEKSLSALEPQALQRSYLINAAGPLAMFAACAPLLRRASAPRAMFLSAQVGSIGDNHLGGWYAYRMAKAALNMGVRTAAIEAARWRCRAAVVAVHPGTTHSGLSKPFVANRKAPVASAQETGARLCGLLGELGPEHNGQFLNWRGQPIEW